MTDSHDVPADRRRRVLLGASGAALALGAASARAGGGRPTSPLYAIARLRYAMSANAYLPTVGDTYVLPLSMLSATDGSADSTLNADNTITINTTGMYRILLSVDWIGAHGHDSALRTAGLRRRPAGSQRIVTSPGVLTRIADTDEQLATQDLPGSATPPTVRFPAPPDGAKTVVTPFPWTPGTIAAFSAVDVDVTMPIAGVVKPGDVALASLSSLSTAAMDVNALDALSISAKVIAPDTVRVSVLNTSTRH